jgi:hypothetical protein
VSFEASLREAPQDDMSRDGIEKVRHPEERPQGVSRRMMLF